VLDLEDWRVLVTNIESAETDVEVTTFHRKSPSRAGPAFVDCSDGDQYWIKGNPNLVRENFTEQVVGSLGICLGAPIPRIEIVKLGPTLQSGQSELSHHAVGFVHASRNEPDCTDVRPPIVHHDEPENRSRFAALAILYTWTGAQDHQFIYKKQAPRLVFSFDHGLFCGAINPENAWIPWLVNAAPVTQLDAFFAPAKLQKDELLPYFGALESVTPLHIAMSVARSPDTWAVTLDAKLAVCQYLERRREEVLKLK
jgi:hypothetical protein